MTIKKKTDGRGGARKGAGRKSSGKKYFSYFLDEVVGNKVSEQENPSEFVQQAIEILFESKELIKDPGTFTANINS